MKKIKISLILNIINVCFILFAFIAMTSDFKFMTDTNILEFPGVNSLQFFTVDSNLLLGIASICFIIYDLLLIKNKINEIPKWLYLLKFVATTSTTLTMTIVVIFLGPVAPTGYFSLFVNSNLFFHFLSPMIGVIVFIFYESTNKITFKEMFLGLIPTVVYGLYYLINVMVHMENGEVTSEYDWYGFAQGGTPSIIFSIVLMHVSTLLIAFLLYLFNRKLQKNK